MLQSSNASQRAEPGFARQHRCFKGYAVGVGGTVLECQPRTFDTAMLGLPHRNNGTAYEKTIRDQAKRFAVDVV